MKGTMTAAMAHKQYDEGVSAFRRHIGDPTLRIRFGREVDSFMRETALGMWHADKGGVTPRHVEYYNAIYCKGAPVPTALFWELSTAVVEYEGFRIPGFFNDLIRYDRQTGSQSAHRFIDLFTLMMLLLAAVDDVVSEEEAGFVNACADQLTALCSKSGLSSDKPALNAAEYVTPKPKEAASSSRREVPVSETKVASAAPGEAPPEPKPSLEETLAELDGLCGLEKVKADVKSLINLVKVRKLREEQGLPVVPMSLHLVFMGNPGTGKTTVARLLAKIYCAIGVLSKGQLVEVDRSGLVAGFVGQTAIKTGEAVQKALGGVLFVDEAYALINQENGNDFGHEAVEVLLKAMEDHRKDFIVIVAGYSDLMEDFIHSNPGLESRFNKYFFFEDYSGEQLYEIFRSLCEKNGYVLTEDADRHAKSFFAHLYEQRDENFGNARDVRNVFEKSIARQCDRIVTLEAPTKQQLMELTLSDLTGGEADAGEACQLSGEETKA